MAASSCNSDACGKIYLKMQKIPAKNHQNKTYSLAPLIKNCPTTARTKGAVYNTKLAKR
jgi:hypothetical protein